MSENSIIIWLLLFHDTDFISCEKITYCIVGIVVMTILYILLIQLVCFFIQSYHTSDKYSEALLSASKFTTYTDHQNQFSCSWTCFMQHFETLFRVSNVSDIYLSTLWDNVLFYIVFYQLSAKKVYIGQKFVKIL